MCSHYRVNDRLMFSDRWRLQPPPGWDKTDLWPGYRGPFLRRPQHSDADPAPSAASIHADSAAERPPRVEVVAGVFGLLPAWAKDEKLARSTYNCRAETAAAKPSFRQAWRRAQHCIIPAVSIFEPDWASGKAVATEITRADGDAMGIAGLWERWRNAAGENVYSFTMLTVNADDHPLMRRLHKPGDEKRMVVILPRGLYGDWLDASASQSMEFMRQFPADRLTARAAPSTQR